MYTILITITIVIAVLLILVVLAQNSKGGLSQPVWRLRFQQSDDWREKDYRFT